MNERYAQAKSDVRKIGEMMTSLENSLVQTKVKYVNAMDELEELRQENYRLTEECSRSRNSPDPGPATPAVVSNEKSAAGNGITARARILMKGAKSTEQSSAEVKTETRPIGGSKVGAMVAKWGN